MQRVTRLFVNRPPLVFVLVALIALVGAFSLATLVQQQFPNIDFPTVNVSVSYPGASPSELRDSVVIPIEDAIAGAPDLDHLTTSIQQNQASISATFNLESNQTTDLTEIQDRIQTAKAALPQDLPAPSVRTFDPAQITVVTLAVSSRSLSLAGLSGVVTNEIVPALEQVDGISNVGANGTVTPALEVQVDPNRLSAWGFTTTDVVSSIQANNVRAPGGIAYLGNRETTIDVRGDIQTPASIENLLLTGSTSVLLGATSPSGSVNQKYTNTSGATNQALSLSNAAGSATATSAPASGAGGGAIVASGSSNSAAAAAAAAAGGGTQSTTGTTPSAFAPSSSVTPLPSPAVPTIAPTSTMAIAQNGASGTAATGAAGTLAATSANGGTAGAATAAGTTSGATAGGANGAAANGTAIAVITPAPATQLVNGTEPAAAAATPAAVASTQPATRQAFTPANPANVAAPAIPPTVPAPIVSLASGSGAASSGLGAQTVNAFSSGPVRPRISDVATVTDSFEPKRVASYVDAKAAITLMAQKATGASEVAAAKNVLAALPGIEAEFPAVQFKVLNDEARFTQQQLTGVLQTLIEGICFTGVAMLFFLRSWRNAIVVLIAIPTSLCVTLFVMKLVNFTIDTVSLLAMTLIIGILVDDSIVVLENVERHFEDGEAPRTAAILGRSEIGPAAIVITLVDVVVFLPIAFLPGQTGRFLAEFGLVVTIATLTSLAVSFTVTPSLAGNWSLLSKWRAPAPIRGFTHGFERVRAFYSERILPGALRFSVPVFILSIVLTAGAVALIPLGFVGFEFIPAVDRGQIFCTVQFPTGTPLTTTDAAIRLLSARFLQLPGVQTITSTSGTAQAGFGGGVNLGSTGQIRVILADDHKVPTDRVAMMMNGIGHRLVPDARVFAVPATGTRGGNQQPIDATVAATRSEPDAYAPKVLQALQETPGTENVNSSALRLSPQIDITFDRERARALDVQIGSAAQAIRAAFGGTLATQFDSSNGTGTKYVQVLYPMADQTKLSTLTNLPVRALNGQIVHLGDFATFKNNPEEALITRINRQTVIHIQSNLQPGYALTKVQRAFMQRVAALHLPSSIVVGAAAGGNQQNTMQTVKGLGTSLILSLGLVYLLMVALYNAYRVPLVIMFAIPVASVGALGALALTNQTLNLYSLIGTVMLVGLVSKNGILLVDFAILKVEAGLDKVSAIKQAARERFRPILMTTLSMIAGMLPLALALDPGSAAKRSLGTVVIGGLTSSLILTLVLVPVVYVWLAPGPPQKISLERLAADAHAAELPVETRS
ncbi:MAG TPA: efflux RND transporter permease subunit [Candidatus Baltobacteraceae bacterium]|nr:efflux RND transporter permease subunit [Candidatus Baltobacteraceae bacterium]